MLIDATHAEETRVVVVDGNKVEEFDFESDSRRQLAGNIYLAKVTRVEPSLQAAFIDYGGNRHGFLAFSEIHPDYYQIPVADREALMEEERAYAEAMKAHDEAEEDKPKRRRRSRGKAAKAETPEDAVVTAEVTGEGSGEVSGMETIDLSDDLIVTDVPEGASPMVMVADTPVETPAADEAQVEETEAEVSAPTDAASDDVVGVEPAEQDTVEAIEPAEAVETSETVETADAPATDDDADAQADTDEATPGQSASDRDDSIESVADEDDAEDILILKNIKNGLQKDGVFVFDFLNADKVKANLVTKETKIVDNITFNIQREIKNNFILKHISFTIDNELHSYTERVKYLDIKKMKSFFEKVGFTITNIFGDYHLANFDSQTSHRLIILAK